MTELINWKKLTEKVEKTMAILQSTDFGPKDGLNEAAFKALVYNFA